MKRRSVCTAVAVLSLLVSMSAQNSGTSIASPTAASQSSAAQNAATAQVPRLVKFTSTIPGFNANEAQAEPAANAGSAATSVVGITFSLIPSRRAERRCGPRYRMSRWTAPATTRFSWAQPRRRACRWSCLPRRKRSGWA